MKKKTNKILLIIPAYNEEKNIIKTCNEILNYNENNHTKYDFIVINDGSTDETLKIIENNHIPHVNLINNLGIGGAVQTGYKYALKNNYDIAIQFDGDGQHNVNYINKIIEPIILGKADMIIGSRFIENIQTFKSTRIRRLGIKIISFFIKLITKKKIYDTTSGMRAVNKKIMEEFAKKYPVEYPEPVSTAEILKKGYVVSELSVEMNERTCGTSSIKTWKNFYYMMNVILSIIIIGLRRYK